MPPGSAKPFEPGGDVDAVTEDIVAVDQDVAQVEADAELDPLVDGHAGIALAHALLEFDGAVRCIHDAGEFDQKPVARRLDDAPAVLADLGVNQLAAMQARQCPRLVRAHQPAVAGYIGGKDGCKPAFNALGRHRETSTASLKPSSSADLGKFCGASGTRDLPLHSICSPVSLPFECKSFGLPTVGSRDHLRIR